MSTVISRSTAVPSTGRARDPFLDVLRTCAILVVVCGHWIMPVLSRQGDTLVTGNSLATPGWWLLTWPLQVMPVFFFAGGAANHHSYTAALARGDNARGWLAARLCRLAIPVLPLLAVWLVVPGVLRDLGLPAQPVDLAAGVVGQLLWFLAVYVLTVAAVPLISRFGLRIVAVFGVVAIGVDALRLGVGVPYVGYVNELLVWLAVSQLGVAYANGTLARLSRSGAAAIGAAGFAATALLVLFGHYPDSMVGLPGQAVSNMAPATVCLLTLGIGQIGVLLALREPILRWATRPTPAKVLRAVGARTMTVYLWHMPAMMVVAGVAVLGFGYATPAPGSPLWLLVTPLWIAALACVLRLLVRVFGRFETPRPAGGVPGVRRIAAAVVLLCVGFTGIAAYGFTNGYLALPWVASIAVGLALAMPGIRDTATGWLGQLVGSFFR